MDETPGGPLGGGPVALLLPLVPAPTFDLREGGDSCSVEHVAEAVTEDNGCEKETRDPALDERPGVVHELMELADERWEAKED